MSNNDYYHNRLLFGNKDDNYDENEDDIKKGFISELNVNEKHENSNGNDEEEDNNFQFLK